MNKKFLIAAILLCIGLLCLIPFASSDKNSKIDRGDIFGEIYAYEKANYPNPNPAFQRIRGLSSHSYRDSGEEFRQSAAESYSKNVIPKGYEHVGVSFSFRNPETFIISFQKKVTDNVIFRVGNRYLVEKKVLQHYTMFSIDGKWIDDSKQIADLRKQYKITDQALEQYNKEILNNFFLHDWCKAFDSAFSPNDWGDVKVEKDWE